MMNAATMPIHGVADPFLVSIVFHVHVVLLYTPRLKDSHMYEVSVRKQQQMPCIVLMFTFTQNFPLACFEPLFHWQDITQLVKQVIHLFTSFTFSKLMANA